MFFVGSPGATPRWLAPRRRNMVRISRSTGVGSSLLPCATTHLTNSAVSTLSRIFVEDAELYDRASPPTQRTDLRQSGPSLREVASESGLAALDSETAVMEAHGLALLKDRRGCITALRDAETSFGKAGAQDRPGWLSYYDAAYLAAKMAHCLRELGDLRNAERFARRSLEMSAGYDRGKLFNTALLASILADRGQLEEACAVGRDAVQLAGHLQSARTLAYLQDFAGRLRRHHALAVISDLDQELRSLGIN